MDNQSTPKERVDLLLVQKGFFSTREQAKRAIMAGLVFSQSERIDKPGTKVPVTAPLIVKGSPSPYVSRGGLKLEKAIRSFQLDLKDKIVLDVGASTGGFTDCALKHGAKLVYAVDVGYGQLAWSLRNDPRVIVMERTNFRYAKREDFTHGTPDFACVDVSFISLRLIFVPLYEVLKPESFAVVLVKPQFEAGKGQVGKKGVVKNPRVHREVLELTRHHALQSGFEWRGVDYSPLKGAEGNVEFLALLYKAEKCVHPNAEDDEYWKREFEKVVTQAHHDLS